MNIWPMPPSRWKNEEIPRTIVSWHHLSFQHNSSKLQSVKERTPQRKLCKRQCAFRKSWILQSLTFSPLRQQQSYAQKPAQLLGMTQKASLKRAERIVSQLSEMLQTRSNQFSDFCADYRSLKAEVRDVFEYQARMAINTTIENFNFCTEEIGRAS